MALLAAVGLVVGSFLGAFTYRFPRRMSVLKGRSLCPKCRKSLTWYDNIPVFSFLLLRGRCRKCGKGISPRYPLIELATTLGFVGIWILGFELAFTVFLLLVFSILMAVFVIDLEEKVIPDQLSFFGLVVVLLFLLATKPSTLYLNLFSGFIAALFLLLVHLATQGRGMGLGDVKFAVFAGTFLGWPKIPVWLFIAFLTGAIVGTILVLVKKASFGKQIAFGPFLVVSLIVAFIWGNQLLNWLFL